MERDIEAGVSEIGMVAGRVSEKRRPSRFLWSGVAVAPAIMDWLKGSKNEVGVSDGVRTRDFRSHSPALYH